MRIDVLELPAVWGAPMVALRAVDAELERDADADLVLLPEASLTGYVSPEGDFDLGRFAEPLDGPTAAALSDLARRRRLHLVAPLVLAEGERCFNAMVAFDPRGALVFAYRKRHPWFPETWASKGEAPSPVVTLAGARVTIAVCFDVHFLEDEAAEQLDDAALLLFPSAWVEERDSRPALLSGLARRHRVAIANANWAPGAVRVPGQGGSAIFDDHGREVARVASSRGARGGVRRARAELDLGERATEDRDTLPRDPTSRRR
jgi:predicted amidohydrolase